MRAQLFYPLFPYQQWIWEENGYFFLLFALWLMGELGLAIISLGAVFQGHY